MIKPKKIAGIYQDKKKNAKQENNTSRGNKPESIGERRKIKKIYRQGKTIQKKQDILKQ